jgi:hypothetical protein
VLILLGANDLKMAVIIVEELAQRFRAALGIL